MDDQCDSSSDSHGQLCCPMLVRQAVGGEQSDASASRCVSSATDSSSQFRHRFTAAASSELRRRAAGQPASWLRKPSHLVHQGRLESNTLHAEPLARAAPQYAPGARGIAVGTTPVTSLTDICGAANSAPRCIQAFVLPQTPSTQTKATMPCDRGESSAPIRSRPASTS